jgi:hypothetical protein
MLSMYSVPRMLRVLMVVVAKTELVFVQDCDRGQGRVSNMDEVCMTRSIALTL